MMQPSLFRRALRKLDKALASFLFVDQWVIMTARDTDYKSLRWSRLQPLLPERDRYWGDPFVVQKKGRHYIFIEEKLYATGLGHIACLTLDDAGQLLSHEVVLERTYHLSYPFVFEHNGDIFLMPESAGNQSIELYRNVRFPDKWEFVKTLMSGVYAVDATLLEGEKQYWLFANIKQPGGSSLNSLYLFFADNPLSDMWTPHPRNPVVTDLRTARPAGRIFEQEGALIRPSQDSSRRYGGALQFNQITRLDEKEYEEITVSTFRPAGGKIRATHTFNQAGGLTVVDAVLRRKK